MSAISQSRWSTYLSALELYGFPSRVNHSWSVSLYFSYALRCFSQRAGISTVRCWSPTTRFPVFFELCSLGTRKTPFSRSTHSVTARRTSTGRNPASRLTHTRLGVFQPFASSQSSGETSDFGFSNRCARYAFHRSRAAGERLLYEGTLPYSSAASRTAVRSSRVR